MVVRLRERVAYERISVEGRPARRDRSGAEDRPVPLRADPVGQGLKLRRWPKTLLLASLPCLSRDRVSSFAYVQ
eukprot:5192888-Prymnesium_polylepis.1